MMQLSILPVAISYEYEPCDIQKALEVYITRRHKYVKSRDEDMASIISGMMQYKGEIHIGIAEPITSEEIEYCSQFAKNERFTSLAKIIDNKIYGAYKLRAINYIAADIIQERKGETIHYLSKYTEKEKSTFIEYMNSRIADFALKTLQQKGEDIELNKSELEDIFLSIYANPLYNSTEV